MRSARGRRERRKINGIYVYIYIYISEATSWPIDLRLKTRVVRYAPGSRARQSATTHGVHGVPDCCSYFIVWPPAPPCLLPSRRSRHSSNSRNGFCLDLLSSLLSPVYRPWKECTRPDNSFNGFVRLVKRNVKESAGECSARPIIFLSYAPLPSFPAQQ